MKIPEEILQEPTFHIKQNFALKNLTTIGVGGNASFYSEIDDLTALSKLIDLCEMHKTPFIVIGSGSNLLISDQGLDLLVIRNQVSDILIIDSPKPQTIPFKEDDLVKISVASGTTLQALVDFTITYGLSGLEKLTGIPGTVGGAIYGNAGAYGQTISDHLTHTLVRYNGLESAWDKQSCYFSYRDSIFKVNHQNILSATFILTATNPHILQQQADEILVARLKKYPPGIKCPGSFFKNLLVEDLPPQILNDISNLKDYFGKVPAWYFLQEVGAIGMRVGGAAVSNIHANLIENTGNATSQDFYDLTTILNKKVKEKFNTTLIPEVQILGQFTSPSTVRYLASPKH